MRKSAQTRAMKLEDKPKRSPTRSIGSDHTSSYSRCLVTGSWLALPESPTLSGDRSMCDMPWSSYAFRSIDG